ncbi:MAG: hypothetical protein GY771_07715 [bacterium]|nr:hypothetical protein [bacterium]
MGRAAELLRNGNTEAASFALKEYIGANPAVPSANDALVAFNLINDNGGDLSAAVDYLQALDDFEEGLGITALGGFLAVAEDEDAPYLLRGSAYIRLAQLSPDEEKPGYLIPAWEQDLETSVKKRAAVELMEYYISEGDEDSARKLAGEYAELYPDDTALSHWEIENYER